MSPKLAREVTLEAGFLAGFGEIEVPRELWRALGRFAVWVEPALVAEWLRLMRGYAAGQGRTLDEGALGVAMTWSEPSREVAPARERALALLGAGEALHCVWSGRRLEVATLDIDHCLPWSAWPCGDLWNLLPAHRRVNQHHKRDRLRRFAEEARSSLPGLDGTAAPDPGEVFAALRMQRLRLRHDQQVPEWAG